MLYPKRGSYRFTDPKQVQEGDIEGANTTLLAYCTPGFIKDMVSQWIGVEAFAKRKNLFGEAVSTHEIGLFHSSIYSLMPQAEGVITDWEYTLTSSSNLVPWTTESKAKKFRDLVLGTSPQTFVHRRVIESTTEFILDGPVLLTFKNWLDNLNPAFPNRHVIGHGKYDEALFTEANSINVFLLLDTIFHIMQAENMKKLLRLLCLSIY